MVFRVGNKEIHRGGKVYIICELSSNHGQSYDKAIELIRAAADTGCDAIKVQTYKPELITMDCDKPDFYPSGTIWDGETLFDLYKRAYLPWEWHEGLMNEANKLGMDFFSAPFDITAVDFLESINVPAYKIASCEISDHILIKKIAQTHKPVFMSTGNASMNDINDAIEILKTNGCNDVCILKCTSAYPAKLENANLKTIKHIETTFDCLTGLSDHTLDIIVPITATALGVSVIEKHFTLNRKTDNTPDASFSLEPAEFKQMVTAVRQTQECLGKVLYGGTKSEEGVKKLRRSLYVIKDIEEDELFTNDNIKSIRPGNGLHTKYYDQIIGKKARRNIEKGTPLQWNLID